MRRIKTLLLLIVFLHIASSLFAKLYIATEDIKVHAGKGNHYKELGIIERGTKVETKDTTGTWRKVMDDGEVGYINSKYLEDATPDAIQDEDTTVIKLENWANRHLFVAICGTIIVLLVLRAIFISISARKSEKHAVQVEEKYKSLIKYWYQCKHCAASIKNDVEPSTNGCGKSLHHLWTNLGEVGQHKYHCKNCGVTVHTKIDPNEHGCPAAPLHRWAKKK